jgi:hypothetical protein
MIAFMMSAEPGMPIRSRADERRVAARQLLRVPLVNSSGAIALFVYILIALPKLRMRRTLERDAPQRLKLRM